MQRVAKNLVRRLGAVSKVYFAFGWVVLPLSTGAASGWEERNPGGGGAFCVAGAGPDGTILVGSDLSGAYLSRDNGHSWTVIGLTHGVTSTHICSLAFHPVQANLFLLGSSKGIFRTENGGNNFRHVMTGGYVSALAFAPSNPQVAYAVVQEAWDSERGRLYRSSDAGATWLPVGAPLNRFRVTKLVVDPQASATLFAVTGRDWFASSPSQVFRSTNGGERWQRLPTPQNVWDFAIDGRNSRILWVTTGRRLPDGSLQGNVWKSINAGRSWKALAACTGAVRPHPEISGVVSVVEVDREAWEPQSGVWQTTNGGTNWSRIGVPNQWNSGWQNLAWCYELGHGVPRTIGVSLANPLAVFWTDAQGAFVSWDGGRSFGPLFTDQTAPGWWRGRGLNNVNLFALAISESKPNQIFAGYFDLGFWRSLDGGVSWQNCNHPDFTGDWKGNGGNTLTILADPARPEVVWATQGSSVEPPDMTLLKSNSAGDRSSWIYANSGMPTGYISGLSLDRNSPVSARTLFVTSQGSVYRSQDDGLTWSLVYPSKGCRVTAVDLRDRNLVYAGGEAGLFRSMQGGEHGTWVEIGPEAFRGSNSLSQFWDEGWRGVAAIHPDPSRRNWVWVAVHGPQRGLYLSRDAGQNWEHVRNDDFLWGIAVDPVNPNRIFVTSSRVYSSGGDADSNGVFLSENGGQSWRACNEGLAWPFAIQVLFDPQNSRTVWIGAPGIGCMRRSF